MKISKFLNYIIILLSIILYTCDDNEDISIGDTTEFILRADYLFETNGNPELTLVLDESSPEIQIQNNPIIGFNSGRVSFQFNGLKPKDNNYFVVENGSFLVSSV